MRRRSRTATAALAAAICLCVVPSAEAAGKRLVGINGLPAPNAVETARLGAAGTDTIRLLVGWREVEPFQGSRFWVRIDEAVANAVGAGMEVLPVVTASPKWVEPYSSRPPIYTGHGPGAWSAFLTDLVARYGPNGAFWAARPDLPRRPFRYYQIWNEVNLRGFWGGRPDHRGYADLVKISSRALRAVDPDARVLLSGLIPYKSVGAGNVDGGKYLKRLLRIRGLRKHADAVAVHPYGRQPKVVLEGIERISRVLNPVRKGKRRSRGHPKWMRKMPIWVTEFGWSTGGELWNVSPVKSDFNQQARWIKRTYKLMRKNAKRFRLRRALYFNHRDFDQGGTDYWSARMGLFDLNGQPKPAWFAYVKRAGGTP